MSSIEFLLQVRGGQTRPAPWGTDPAGGTAGDRTVLGRRCELSELPAGFVLDLQVVDIFRRRLFLR